jgi:phage major head subunit gpT-like protein
MPQPTQNAALVDTLIEKSKSVEPEDWYLTLHISNNAIDDDQTGTLEGRFKDIVPAFQRHINARVFTFLNDGDNTTSGTCVDGLALFDDSHLWAGAKYTTAQDNQYDLAISLDNFNTVWVAARGFVDDAGNYFNYNYDLLVTSPTNNSVAANITGNREAYDTANRELNPYAGQLSYITVPEFDTTAWVLVATGEPTKPLFVAVKKRPQLNDMWFDAQAGDGGIHYFQYHARYVVDFADWPTAIMGDS